MDGNRKKPDGRLQFQKERFFSRFCALQVLFQQEFQPEIEWDAHRWSYYLCMISDVLDEMGDYLPSSLETPFAELNDVWKTLAAAEKSLSDMEKLQEEEAALPEEERTVEETMLAEARHKVHSTSFSLDEMTTKMLKRSCFQFAKKLVDGVIAKKQQLDEQIMLAAKNWRLERMGRMDLNVMRIGAFELLNVPEPPATPTPPATAINEAIELSKVFCQADSRRFVNGVLDKLRKNNQIERKTEGAVPPSEDASTETDAAETQPPEEKTEG